MKVQNESGSFVVGIEHEGVVHRAFEVRPQLVADSIDVFESADAPRAVRSDAYYSLCLLSRQIVSIGTLPKELITPALLMTLTSVDSAELYQARDRIEKRLRSFRHECERRAEEGAGNVEAGVSSD